LIARAVSVYRKYFTILMSNNYLFKDIWIGMYLMWRLKF